MLRTDSHTDQILISVYCILGKDETKMILRMEEVMVKQELAEVILMEIQFQVKVLEKLIQIQLHYLLVQEKKELSHLKENNDDVKRKKSREYQKETGVMIESREEKIVKTKEIKIEEENRRERRNKTINKILTAYAPKRLFKKTWFDSSHN